MIREEMPLKLGRRPSLRDTRDFMLKDYLREPLLPLVPATFGHQNLIGAWGMLGNDQYGDCVIASSDHLVMLWTKEGSNITAPMSKTNTLKDYSAVCGFDPNDPYNTDNGCEMRTAMGYARSTGMLDANGKRHKIGAYAAIDLFGGIDELMAASYIFSGVKVGIDFPASAMTQFNNGQPWTVVKGSPIEGGHDVPVIGRDSKGILCVTWGKLQYMSADFLRTYASEAWVGFSPEFLNQTGLSPEGFNIDQLNADIAELSGESPPPPTPEPTPIPPGTCEENAKKAKAKLLETQLILRRSTSKYVKQVRPLIAEAIADLPY